MFGLVYSSFDRHNKTRYNKQWRVLHTYIQRPGTLKTANTCVAVVEDCPHLWHSQDRH